MGAQDKKGNGASWWRRFRKLLRWILPVLVLVFVFRRIDLAELQASFLRTSPVLFAAALLLAPVLVLIGAVRWQVLLSIFTGERVPAGFIQRHYWTGLALGFFAPASLGWDAYRVGVAGRRYGGYAGNVLVVLVEKVVALCACMSLIVLLYPFLRKTVTPEAGRIAALAALLLAVAILGVVLSLLVLRVKKWSRGLDRIEDLLHSFVTRTAARFGFRAGEGERTFSFRETMGTFASPGMSVILLCSLAIQMVSAVKTQVFFQALGYDLPFVINLFAAPTLYFIFMLPVSFGSVGIREGVYVLLYGMFGVPAEIALLVSLFNLCGMLLNNIIGAAVMFFTLEEKPSEDAGGLAEKTEIQRR